MKLPLIRAIALLSILLMSLAGSSGALAAPVLDAPSSLNSDQIYTCQSRHSPDGIGKFFMGREIAKVMGHTEAMWLERPSREFLEKPEEAIAAFKSFNLQI